MRISNKFGAPHIVHCGVHYYPDEVKDGYVTMVFNDRGKWRQDSQKISAIKDWDSIIEYWKRKKIKQL